MDTKGLSGAEAFLRLLRQMGVEQIFASPGSEWAPVWEHLAKPYGSGAEIPAYLSTRHEEVAVAMASGYAKACGKLAAVMIHTTVGALHATMALRAARHERVPMVVPILIVLFNNAGYLSQKSGIPRHYPDGWAVKSQTFVGTSIAPSPDYAALARAFDGYGETVEAPGEVRAALARGFEAVGQGRVALLDMRLEPINRRGGS